MEWLLNNDDHGLVRERSIITSSRYTTS